MGESLIPAAVDGPAPAVSLRLLGGFELRAAGKLVELPLAVQRVVAFLALQDAPQLRLYVSGVLWPDVPENRSYANLRSALWRLKRTGFEIVDASGANVRLGSGVAVDARMAAGVARELLEDPDGPVDARTFEALAQELLPDWYDEWVVGPREELRNLGLHALELSAERLAGDGRFGLAAQAGLAAVHWDPLRESANRALIRVFLAEGNGADAIRHYRRYRSLLDRELGIEPSSLMEDLLGELPRFRQSP